MERKRVVVTTNRNKFIVCLTKRQIEQLMCDAVAFDYSEGDGWDSADTKLVVKLGKVIGLTAKQSHKMVDENFGMIGGD
jgi:hypothetical protein